MVLGFGTPHHGTRDPGRCDADTLRDFCWRRSRPAIRPPKPVVADVINEHHHAT
jgi:hypothetical protein